MTIKEWICEKEAIMVTERLKKLEEIDAPEIMIKTLKGEVEKLKAGDIKVGGDKNILDEEFIDFEQRKGNGGKVYLVINGQIRYFPNAKYGRYIIK